MPKRINIKPVKKTKTPKLTRILFVLDESTSMGSVRNETIAGFNTFLEEQKKIKGKATMTLVKFSSAPKMVFSNVPIEHVQPLDHTTFTPNGWTALYDAVGDAITSCGDLKPKGVKTILAILTDGEENKSYRFSFERITAMLKECQGNPSEPCADDWEVLYLGSQMGARQTAIDMGIKLQNVAAFDVGAKGMSDAIKTMSATASSYRGIDQNIGGVFYAAGAVDTQAMYETIKKEITTTTVTTKKADK